MRCVLTKYNIQVWDRLPRFKGEKFEGKKKWVIGPEQALKTRKVSSSRFQGLRIIICGLMLYSGPDRMAAYPSWPKEVPSAQVSAFTALPSESFFFHILMSLSVLAQMVVFLLV